MARAKAGPIMPARDDVRETVAVVSAEARVRELELQVHRLAQANRQLAEREASLRAIFDAGARRRRPGRQRRHHPRSQPGRPCPDRARRQLAPLRRAARHAGHRSASHRLPIARHPRLPRRVGDRRSRDPGAARPPLLDRDARHAAARLRRRRQRARLHLPRDHGPPRRRGGPARPRGALARRLRLADGRHHVLGSQPARSPTPTTPSCELVGYSREDLEAGRVSWIEMTPPEERHLDALALRERGGDRRLRLLREALHPQGRLARADRRRRGAGRRRARSRRRLRAGHHRPPPRRGAAARERGPLPQHGGARAADPVGGRRRRASAPTSTSTGSSSAARRPSRRLGHGFFTALHPDDAAAGERLFREATAQAARPGTTSAACGAATASTAT